VEGKKSRLDACVSGIDESVGHIRETGIYSRFVLRKLVSLMRLLLSICICLRWYFPYLSGFHSCSNYGVIVSISLAWKLLAFFIWVDDKTPT